MLECNSALLTHKIIMNSDLSDLSDKGHNSDGWYWPIPTDKCVWGTEMSLSSSSLWDTLLPMYTMLGPISESQLPPRRSRTRHKLGATQISHCSCWRQEELSVASMTVIVQAYLKGNGNQAFTGPVAQFFLFQNIVKVYLFNIVLKFRCLSDRSFWHKYLEAILMQAFKI